MTVAGVNIRWAKISAFSTENVDSLAQKQFQSKRRCQIHGAPHSTLLKPTTLRAYKEPKRWKKGSVDAITNVDAIRKAKLFGINLQDSKISCRGSLKANFNSPRVIGFASFSASFKKARRVRAAIKLTARAMPYIPHSKFKLYMPTNAPAIKGEDGWQLRQNPKSRIS
jgi:hypothetical protein